jgi:hypothetical protein
MYTYNFTIMYYVIDVYNNVQKKKPIKKLYRHGGFPRALNLCYMHNISLDGADGLQRISTWKPNPDPNLNPKLSPNPNPDHG